MTEAATPAADVYRLGTAQGGALHRRLLITAAVAGLLSLLGAVLDYRQFFWSYLTAFVFVLSLGVGALFWVMIHHLTDAGWSVVVRRTMEHLCATVPWLALLFVPVLAGMGTLYAWTHAHAPDDPHYHLWALKRPYLNVPFFVVRAAVYFGVWGWLAWNLTRWSTQQDDSGDPELTRRLQRLSAPGMILLGLTTTFAAFDWLMSLDYEWYSTIYGVFFCAGAMISSLALLTLLVLCMRAAGLLRHTITVEHLHDLGKLLFGFTIFGTYIAFSQYFLIWYGNIPEETRWFVNRERDTWYGVGWVLLFGRFLVPFFVFLPRWSKRSPLVLSVMCVWLLVFQFLDLHWQVMPMLHTQGFRPHWLDFSLLVALVAACGLIVQQSFRSRALIPIRDPRLAESLRFHNN